MVTGNFRVAGGRLVFISAERSRRRPLINGFLKFCPASSNARRELPFPVPELRVAVRELPFPAQELRFLMRILEMPYGKSKFPYRLRDSYTGILKCDAGNVISHAAMWISCLENVNSRTAFRIPKREK